MTARPGFVSCHRQLWHKSTLLLFVQNCIHILFLELITFSYSAQGIYRLKLLLGVIHLSRICGF